MRWSSHDTAIRRCPLLSLRCRRASKSKTSKAACKAQ